MFSSAIFGLAHFPLWGSNAIVEAVLGGVLGFAYWYSEYNLAVPIAIHTIYDFAVTYFTWNSARSDPKVNAITAWVDEADLDAMIEMVSTENSIH